METALLENQLCGCMGSEDSYVGNVLSSTHIRELKEDSRRSVHAECRLEGASSSDGYGGSATEDEDQEDDLNTDDGFLGTGAVLPF